MSNDTEYPFDIDLDSMLNGPELDILRQPESETCKNARYTKERCCLAQNSALFLLSLRNVK